MESGIIASIAHNLITTGVSDLVGSALDDRASLLSTLPLKLGGLRIYDHWHVLFPAAISSRLKTAKSDTIDLPYTGVLEDLRLFVTSERIRQISGLDDIVDAWSTDGLAAALKLWYQQHILFELVMASTTSAYDTMSDRRSYVWRRLFTAHARIHG